MTSFERTVFKHTAIKRLWADGFGFSLIELLVALSVFSIAALALLEGQANSARTGSVIQSRALASIVAENRTALFLGSILEPEAGTSSGVSDQLGAHFNWRAERTLIQGAGMMRQTVVVTDETGNALASLTSFRVLP